MKLSTTQQEFIEVVVDLYENSKTAIKCEEIAERIHRTHGTIRNQNASFEKS
ncbi:MAG: hypothetical protein Q8O41_01490 [Candidatus Methanoperedens sp.]|nr:hypothetical protein [Candidatus Methanoperedens sp.]